jgi:hypothetical protein
VFERKGSMVKVIPPLTGTAVTFPLRREKLT